MDDLISITGARLTVPPVSDTPRVDVTAGLDGYRVWINGRVFCEARTITAASRIQSALMTLDAYDLLGRVQTAQDAVRSMLVASLCDPEGAA